MAGKGRRVPGQPIGSRLQAIVTAAGCPAEQLPAYLAFAQEFAHSLRRRPYPDFTVGTKQVVTKWFRRGLSGRRLWLVGAAILRERFGRGYRSR